MIKFNYLKELLLGGLDWEVFFFFKWPISDSSPLFWEHFCFKNTSKALPSF